jgi:hypothetical protein
MQESAQDNNKLNEPLFENPSESQTTLRSWQILNFV